MNILFLSYWGVEEGLSKATVLPHLKILSEVSGVGKIVYCSIERSGCQLPPVELMPNVVHIPLYTGKRYYHKILDFVLLPGKLKRLASVHEISLMLCRGAPAGALGYLVSKGIGLPYAVESFEPHARYMVEAGVWARLDLRYFFQRRWERLQLETASAIITVSEAYKTALLEQGVAPQRVCVAPCGVNLGQFIFKDADRKRTRQLLGFAESCKVGIYVGKFGGLYYSSEAFRIFRQALLHIKEFRLIILTPDARSNIADKLIDAGFERTHFHIAFVSHDEVPAYLSGSDFAFALFKRTPSSRFLSPIKVGEYWANGLPVMLTKGVGDDSEIVEQQGGGATFVLEDDASVIHALKSIDQLTPLARREQLSERFLPLATKYRNFDRVRKVYDSILNAV